MSISERVLLALSRPATAPEAPDPAESLGLDSALDLLSDEYPGFTEMIAGRAVADFGCGTGLQAIAMALRHACSVVGIDTNAAQIEACRRRAAAAGLGGDQCRFVTDVGADLHGRFDAVISLNSFEHFRDAPAALRQMSALLAPGGRIFLTFGPPWYAPYGSHMHFFCKVPWLNLLFSEKTIMSARRRYRDDGATRYEDVANGLNRMSIAKFERLVADSGLHLESLRLRGVKGLDIVGAIPVLRELLVNRVTAVLVARART